jgi:hypothetical protein
MKSVIEIGNEVICWPFDRWRVTEIDGPNRKVTIARVLLNEGASGRDYLTISFDAYYCALKVESMDEFANLKLKWCLGELNTNRYFGA